MNNGNKNNDSRASDLDKGNTDLFSQRLKVIIGNESVSSFAKKCGLSEALIRRYLNGSIPGIDKAVQISKAANRSISWLLTGEEETVVEKNEQYFEADKRINNLVYLDRYNIEAAAGHGSFNESEKIDMQYAFRREWLESKGIKETDLVIICAQGNSMQPTIANKDLLMIDTGKKQFTSDSIYVIRVNDLLLVKRVQPTLEGFNLVSDNKEYKDIEVAYNKADDLQVIGKVVWAGKEFD